MSQDGNQKNSGGDDEVVLIAIVFGMLCAAGYAFWYFYSGTVTQLLLTHKVELMRLVSIIHPLFDDILAWAQRVNPDDVEWSQISYIYTLTGKIERWVLVPVIFSFALYFAFIVKPREDALKKVLDSDKLIAFQAQEWGAIGMSVNFDPSKIYDGAWAPSMQPMEWINRNIISPETKLIDRELLRLKLQEQIGPDWSSYADQPEYIRVIMAALACYLVTDRDEGRGIFDDVGRSLMKSGTIAPNIVKRADQIVANPKYGEPLNAVMRRHAYLSTGLLSLLKRAREESGVIASADFRWLKGSNRTLWYALNGLGRHTTWIESVAIRAHWEMETRHGRPINQPMLDQAIQAVYDAFMEAHNE